MFLRVTKQNSGMQLYMEGKADSPLGNYLNTSYHIESEMLISGFSALLTHQLDPLWDLSGFIHPMLAGYCWRGWVKT